MPDTIPSDGPDITEDEARRILALKLGCKAEDIQIKKHWTILTPKPVGMRADYRDDHIRASAGLLREACARVVCEGTGEVT